MRGVGAGSDEKAGPDAKLTDLLVTLANCEKARSFRSTTAARPGSRASASELNPSSTITAPRPPRRSKKMARWLTSTGLVLGMAGVVIIFIWGPPQPDFQEGVALGATPATRLPDGTTVAEQIEKTKTLKRRYTRMSRLGLALIFAGFAVQAVALWMP
jgi:hypothetical protein